MLRTIYRNVVPPAFRARISAFRHRLRHTSARRDPLFQRSLSRLGDLRDAHAGETCVILGNGPSMRDFDLRRLAGRKTFCLNRGYLLWNDQGLTPDYLVSVNSLVLEQFSAELQAVEALKFVPWTHRDDFETGRGDVIFFEERWDETFISDARDGLAPIATVTNAALQLAYHMGFSTVVLLGIDHNFEAKGPAHAEIEQRQGDVDHFRPDYFGPGVKWNLPDLTTSERGYLLARQAFDTAGRRILNATPGTKLKLFETADIEELLPRIG